MKKSRNTSLKPDKFGNYVRELGYLDPTKKKQLRLNLGKDQKKAEERLSRLITLLEESTAVCDGIPMWSAFAKYAAKLIERGETLIPFAPEKNSSEDSKQRDNVAVDYVWKIRELREHYPSLIIAPTDSSLFNEGKECFDKFMAKRVRQTNHLIAACHAVEISEKLPQNIFPGTLYEAFDKFAESLTKRCTLHTGKVSAWGCTQTANIKRLKEHQKDFMLMLLDYNRIAEIVSYWKNVPLTKRGKGMAPDTIQTHLKTFKAFINWLADDSDYAWTLPDKIHKIKFTPKKNIRSNSMNQVTVFSESELAILNRYATTKERLILLLGLNCGFAPSELGTLRINEVLLRRVHPYASTVKWNNGHDSYIRRSRRKTGVWGEFLLWDQTISVLEQQIQKRLNEGAAPDDLVFVGNQGEPAYQEGLGRYYAGQYFSNPWSRLIKRIQADIPSFPRLSIGKLRKTGGNLVREHGNGDLASIFLTHGKANFDDLLDVYTNRPFAKLFKVLKELEMLLKPVFEAAPDCLGGE